MKQRRIMAVLCAIMLVVGAVYSVGTASAAGGVYPLEERNKVSEGMTDEQKESPYEDSKGTLSQAEDGPYRNYESYTLLFILLVSSGIVTGVVAIAVIVIFRRQKKAAQRTAKDSSPDGSE